MSLGSLLGVSLGSPKYGFDFDGVTAIQPYTNPLLNPYNTSISFKMLYSAGEIDYVYNNIFGNTNSHLTIGTSASDEFSFVYRHKNTNNSYTTNSIPSTIVLTDNTLYEIEIKFITGVVYPKLQLFINGVLEGEKQLIAETYNPFYFSANVIQNIYYIGSAGGAQFCNSIISDFIVLSDGIKVFEETFNEVTKGTIIGIEQYAVIEEGVSLQSFCGIPISNYSSILGESIT